MRRWILLFAWIIICLGNLTAMHMDHDYEYDMIRSMVDQKAWPTIMKMLRGQNPYHLTDYSTKCQRYLADCPISHLNQRSSEGTTLFGELLKAYAGVMDAEVVETKTAAMFKVLLKSLVLRGIDMRHKQDFCGDYLYNAPHYKRWFDDIYNELIAEHPEQYEALQQRIAQRPNPAILLGGCLGATLIFIALATIAYEYYRANHDDSTDNDTQMQSEEQDMNDKPLHEAAVD